MLPMAKALPKPVAILLVIYFCYYLAKCLITGAVSPPNGNRPVHRNEQPGQYWFFMLSYLVCLTYLAIILCRAAKLL
jgi:hypothetical protein